jgi:hypothetical protein
MDVMCGEMKHKGMEYVWERPVRRKKKTAPKPLPGAAFEPKPNNLGGLMEHSSVRNASTDL